MDVRSVYTVQSGRTVLHMAVEGGSKEVVELLLGAGADAKAVDKVHAAMRVDVCMFVIGCTWGWVVWCFRGVCSCLVLMMGHVRCDMRALVPMCWM